MQKIDKKLLNFVNILSENKKIRCVIFVQNIPNFVFHNIFKKCVLDFYPFINAFLVEVSKEEMFVFAGLKCVLFVSSVQKASIFLYHSRNFLKIDNIHNKGITGKGVCVAVIDTGIFPHLDFCLGKNRVKKFVDFVNNKNIMYDDNGHGTFVCGVLAGSGLVKNKKFKGIAPNAEIIAIKALDKTGETTAENILKAMQWVMDNKDELNIKVVCMSFGSSPLEENYPLIEGAKVLWENGICVVCAGGNDGPKLGSIKSPGACPNVITVGSVGNLNENLAVAPFSSRGPAFDYIKPDILAPGVEIVSTTNKTSFYDVMSGTSVSTPFVAGVCALMIEKNKNISPNEIKQKLMENAQKIDDNKNASGCGLICLENLF